ncbi:MAG: hypothetical protein E6Q27_04800 [Aeromicrobium sp.]|nr:MAG: hypothetical protein E6Q27_04800 [Aeromicrobium sp.]
MSFRCFWLNVPRISIVTTFDPAKTLDLVLEGGGVKGIALVGAAVALAENDFVFARIGGSSAGALVGSIMAAMQKSGESLDRAADIVRTINYEDFLDRRQAAQMLHWWPTAANAWGVLFHLGAFHGKCLQDWLSGVLGDLGVRTFSDLYFDDPGSALAPENSFHLVVPATDLSRQRTLHIPWDLPSYGRSADEFSVARAVHASAAIPFLFEPVRLRSRFGISTLADGSLLSSYPIEVFDRTDGLPARWPTVGVRLSSPAGENSAAKPVTGLRSMAESLIFTVVDSTQVRHVSDPSSLDRSIFAKPRGVRWTDFHLTREQQEHLFDSGFSAANRWLKRHDHRPPMRPHIEQ